MSRMILYFGNDTKYQVGLENMVTKYAAEFDLKFKGIKFNLIGDFGHYFFQVIDFQAKLIVLDMTDLDIVGPMEYFIFLLKTCKNTRKIPLCLMVGDPDEINIDEVYASGIDLVYTKTIDLEVILSDCFFLLTKQKLGKTDFAVGKMKDELTEYKFVTAHSLGKISYLSEKGVRVEVNVEIPEEGSENFDYTLLAPAFERLNMKRFESMKQIQAAPTSYKGYAFSYYMPIPYTSTGANRIKKLDVKEYLEEQKEKFEDNPVEILILDAEYSLYRSNSTKMQGNDYKINYLTHLSDDLHEINEIRPNLIFFQLSDGKEFNYANIEIEGPEGGAKESKSDNQKESEEGAIVIRQNDFSVLEDVITKVRETNQYRPVIFIFRYPGEVKELVNTYQYPYLLSTSKSIEETDVKDFVKLFKNSAKYTNNYIHTSADSVNNVVFSHGGPVSLLRATIPLDIIYITETELIFHCPSPLADFSQIYVPDPYDIYVTIRKIEREIEGYNTKVLYKGVINGLTEEGKQEIRVLVNEIVFSPIKKFREVEAKRMADKNRAYLQENRKKRG